MGLLGATDRTETAQGAANRPHATRALTAPRARPASCDYDYFFLSGQMMSAFTL
jgi:hypothetical protein